MAANDEAFYQRFIRRAVRFIAIIGIAGALAAAGVRGWKFGLGFLLGAGLSYISFWRWRRLAESLGGGAKPQSAWGMILRLGLLIGAGYVIIKYLELNAVAVFLGLFVSIAAVIATLLLELIYGT